VKGGWGKGLVCVTAKCLQAAVVPWMQVVIEGIAAVHLTVTAYWLDVII